ncbi:hypothetical protein P280DRAFT_468828 [Massarina eburnea CBS 473.64]|uniref:F-box domain-containing protein n=1 Tax=Massarina eburnea CBS 473.64 TaxID=1395130 RepID=A0A6A6S025_9PLEO|nr:hypothetical protein P280DRAFT_468828 [Massarina eburnea CBS 473.64]
MLSPHTLLSLPTEIRLDIWDLVLTNDAFSHQENTHELVLNSQYTAPTQLNLLLTCHQIRNEIGIIPTFQRAAFVVKRLKESPYSAFACQLLSLPKDLIAAVKKLVLPAQWLDFDDPTFWSGGAMFLEEKLQLFELTFFFENKVDALASHAQGTICKPPPVHPMARRMRLWNHVQVLRFIRNESNVHLRKWYRALVGQILKEDHYQRYDSEQAPNLGMTRWEWKYDVKEHVAEFFAKPPHPVLPEAEYMEMVAPMIHDLIADMEAEGDESLSLP